MPHFTLRQTLTKNATSSGWNPEATALIFGEEQRTYQELSDAADRIAAGLTDHGFGKGDRLLALLPNCIEYVELFYAVATLGGVIVPANYLLSPKEIAHQWADSEATWLVVHERFLSGTTGIPSGQLPPNRFFAVGECPGVTPYESLRIDRQESLTTPSVEITDVALLQYTSGTSGLPKAATHTHSTLMWNTIQQVADFRLTKDDVYVCVPSLCWAAGFHDFLLGVLWVGGKVVLMPSQGFTPDLLAEEVDKHGGTIMVMVPSVLRLVVESGVGQTGRLDSLRMILSGGEALPIELIQETQAQLPNTWLAQGFGMTEGPMIMTFLAQEDAVRKQGSAGRALSATQIRVVDDQDRDVEPGQVGEIVVRSAGNMVGYANAEAKNAEVFRNGWFHTGDSGRLDEDGYLYVVGRLKDMYISGGLNVYPAEIERVIVQHEKVLETAVIGVPDPRYGEVGLAYVVVDTADADLITEIEDDLRRHTAENLAGYKVPRVWKLSSERLPRTASGKIKKSVLRPAVATPAP